MKKKQIKHESYQDAATIKKYLQQIIEGIERGKINISNADDSLELEPSGLLGLTIKASQSKSSQQLRLKIAWQVKDVIENTVEDDVLILE